MRAAVTAGPSGTGRSPGQRLAPLGPRLGGVGAAGERVLGLLVTAAGQRVLSRGLRVAAAGEGLALRGRGGGRWLGGPAGKRVPGRGLRLAAARQRILSRGLRPGRQPVGIVRSAAAWHRRVLVACAPITLPWLLTAG
ncbi:MAG TPA: hypothetical protein DEH11_11260 [Actinobacteria bacterium]|nr:hypothetical protein [Actinomycetota bacterium]